MDWYNENTATEPQQNMPDEICQVQRMSNEVAVVAEEDAQKDVPIRQLQVSIL